MAQTLAIPFCEPLAFPVNVMVVIVDIGISSMILKFIVDKIINFIH